MAKTAPGNYSRIELWIPNEKARYANQVAGHYKTRRKLYLEKLITDHLNAKKKEIRPITQAQLALIDKNLKAANKAKKQKK